MRARAVVILVVGLALMVGAALVINNLGGDDTSPAQVSVVAGGPFGSIAGLAVAADGSLRVSDPDSDRILAVSPTGTVTPVLVAAGELDTPHGIALTADGRLLVADTGHGRVAVLDPATGSVATLAEVVPAANPLANSVSPGAATDPGRQRVLFGGAAVDQASQPQIPTSAEPGPLAQAPDGALFFVDGITVRRRDPDGTVLTVAGGGGESITRFDDVAATSLALPDVRGLTVDPGGHVYVSGTWGLGELSPAGRLHHLETDQPVPFLGPLVAPALGVIVGAGEGQLYRIQLVR